ncbi:MAG: 2,3-bisphosphoglycerate-independent phosphoglycerate mutase [Oscillospiraceae bacterium]|nr:2,3-bisphosphoglycerate-independent phosphoglycerate mutase [Oscillospiraceae bacterium]
MKKAPTTWVILDGFGLREAEEGNAVKAARTPELYRLSSQYAHTALAASGADVGLEPGQRGNSAAGRSSLETGRIIPQPQARIDRAIEDGTFFENPAYNAAMLSCLEHGTALHLVGLLSDGGVHASIDHLFALLKLASIKGLRRVYIHAILDGFDVLPRTGRDFVERTVKKCAELGVGRIATIVGRWYAMDRKNRPDRVEQAYDAMVYGEGVHIDDPVLAVNESYHDGIPDDRTEPIVCDTQGMVSDQDSVIFFNYRGDRADALTRAFTDPDFNGFQRELFPVTFVSNVSTGLPPQARSAFPLPEPKNALVDYLRGAGMKVIRVEDTEHAVEAALSGLYDLVVLYLPDCSAAGHSGDFARAVRAVEAMDAAVGKVADATLQMGGIVVVTAGHGNVEEMVDAEGQPAPMNTTNRVPFILCGAGTELREGRLADVAPTILDVLGLAKPPEMTGQTLILR